MNDPSLQTSIGNRPATDRVTFDGAIRVALVNDYEIILRGLQAMLAPFGDRVHIVERQVGGTPDEPADVALFDTFAGRRDALSRAESMLADGKVKHVVMYTFDAAGEFLDQARAIGVSGVVLKSVTGGDLVDAIERIMAGELVGLDNVVRGARTVAEGGLSTREQEVLAMLALGRTNAAIAKELFLSVDTVKTYVRRVFAKLGVDNRTQAALHPWAESLRPRTRQGNDHSIASPHGNGGRPNGLSADAAPS